MICLVFFRIQIALFLMSICGAESLYDVLGVKRTAGLREIEEAYTKLANLRPDEIDVKKFVMLKEAYETLKDPKKKRKYDQWRCTFATGRQRSQSHETLTGFLRPLKIFERFFANELIFSEKELYLSFYEKENILSMYSTSLREYESTILPNSYRKPCVIFAFTDCCWGCNTMETYLQDLKENFGLCAATFNVETSGDLRTYFGIDTVPTLIAVSAGRVRYFNGNVTKETLQNFTRTLFSFSPFSKVGDGTYQVFLDSFEDNRVKVIFFGQKQDPWPRILASFLFYEENIAFAYVYIEDPAAGMLIEKYNVNKKRETLLLFDEDRDVPIDISMQQFPRTKIDDVLEKNKYLKLPRLSSQKHFDELCPHENTVNKRTLCVVLVTKKRKEHDQYRESFRNYSQRSKLAGHERVMFTYIYEDTQKEFVLALTKERMKDFVLALTKEKMEENDTGPLKVAIVWRVEANSLSYEWLETGWDLTRKKEKICEKSLENRLAVLLTTDSILPYQTNLPELYNEHGASLLVRIGHKLLFCAGRILSYLTSYRFVALVELLISLIFCLLMAYVMWEAIIKRIVYWWTGKQKIQRQPRPPSRSLDETFILMYELNSSNYKTLVEESDTGLTIVVLVDKTSKDKLQHEFLRIVFPYSRESTLTFGYVNLEYHISWFLKLLQECTYTSLNMTSTKMRKKIRNCVGTVLALDGVGKCYYVYKPNSDGLLNGLNIWLDKVRSGSFTKYKIKNWPAMK